MCCKSAGFCLKDTDGKFPKSSPVLLRSDTAAIERIPEGVFVGKIVLFPNSIHLELHIASVAHILIFTDSVV